MSRFMFRTLMVVCVVIVSGVISAASFVFPTTKFLSRQVDTVTTVNAQSIDIAFFSVIDNAVTHAQARVVAIDLVTGKAKAFNIQGAFKRHNGTLEMVGARIENEFESGDPITGAWDATISHDDVTNRLFVTVTGSLNSTVEWMADLEVDLYEP